MNTWIEWDDGFKQAVLHAIDLQMAPLVYLAMQHTKKFSHCIYSISLQVYNWLTTFSV